MKHKIISGQELFTLIQSLTKAEKRHFKLVTAKEKGEKFYISLFNLLNAQDTYNEREILQKLRSEKSKKNYSQAKKYLFEKIVASLHNLGTYKNADSQVKELIEMAKLLRYKGLYNQAQRYLDLAEQEAIEGDTIYNRLHINALAYQFSINAVDALSPVERTRALNAAGKELSATIAKYLEVYHIFRTVKSQQVMSPYCRSREEQELLQELIAPLRDFDHENFPVVGSRIHYHLTMNMYNSMTGNHAQSVEHCRHVIELVKAHPKIDNTIYPQLSNYISAALKARRLDDVEERLEEFLGGLKENPDFHEQKLIYERWLLYTTQYLNYQGRFKETLQLHKAERERIAAYSPTTNYISFLLTYHLSVAHFFCDKHAEAWSLVMKIINEQDPRSDIYLYAKIFSLLILYERKETDHLPYALRSTYRALIKRERLFEVEKHLLDFIRNAGKNISKDDFKTLAKNIERAFEDPFEQGMLYYFDLIRWLKAR